MMFRAVISIFFSLLFFFSSSVFAEFDPVKLEVLINKGDPAGAYELGRMHMDEWEGDPEFDLYFGIAAIDSGHISEGIFALERVLFMQPDQLRARVELARGFFMLGEDLRARQEFEKVLAKNPPPNVQANIQKFLDVIRLRETKYRTSANAYAEFALGHDANVNSAPGDANFFSPLLGQGTLDSSGVESHDLYSVLSFGGQVNQPLHPGISAFAKLDIQTRNNQDYSAFDTDALTAQAGIKINRKHDQFKFSLQKQHYWVGSQLNRDLFGVSGEWTRNLDQQTQVNGFLQYSNLVYPGAAIRDARSYTAGFGALHAYKTKFQPLAFATLLVGKDLADESAGRSISQRTYTGARAGAILTVHPKMSITPSVFVQRGWYGAQNILFQTTRVDVFYLADLSMTYLLDKNWKIKANVAYARNDSNIILNDYDRVYGQASIRYDFY